VLSIIIKLLYSPWKSSQRGTNPFCLSHEPSVTVYKREGCSKRRLFRPIGGGGLNCRRSWLRGKFSYQKEANNINVGRNGIGGLISKYIVYLSPKLLNLASSFYNCFHWLQLKKNAGRKVLSVGQQAERLLGRTRGRVEPTGCQDCDRSPQWGRRPPALVHRRRHGKYQEQRQRPRTARQRSVGFILIVWWTASWCANRLVYWLLMC